MTSAGRMSGVGAYVIVRPLVSTIATKQVT